MIFKVEIVIHIPVLRNSYLINYFHFFSLAIKLVGYLNINRFDLAQKTINQMK